MTNEQKKVLADLQRTPKVAASAYALGSRPAVLDALCKLGYVKRTHKAFEDDTYNLTDTGKKAAT